jgi:GNAT superfamily N-acetyltransferase
MLDCIDSREGVFMLWRIRTELADRPGALAELAARCGADEINILSLEVFTAETGVVDELVVSAGAGWNAQRLAGLVAQAGCSGTTVRPCQADVLADGPTRYLRSVLRLLEDPCAVDEEIERLQGFDEYTPAEWARADVLVEIAGRLAAAADAVSDPGPADVGRTPLLRRGTVSDAEAVIAMHERCSHESRAQRYHVPMIRLTSRTARHLAAPAGGASILACVGDSVVGMATVAPWQELGPDGRSVMELAVLVEDGWQRRGVGTALLRQVATAAGDLGADRVVCLVQPGNIGMLRTVSAARLRARIISTGGHLTVSIPLTDRGVVAAGEAADRLVALSGRYGLSRGSADLDEQHPAAWLAGASAGPDPFAGAATGPADPDRARPHGRDGAARLGGS